MKLSQTGIAGSAEKTTNHARAVAVIDYEKGLSFRRTAANRTQAVLSVQHDVIVSQAKAVDPAQVAFTLAKWIPLTFPRVGLPKCVAIRAQIGLILREVLHWMPLVAGEATSCSFRNKSLTKVLLIL